MQSNVFAVFEVGPTSCALRTDDVSELLPLPRLSQPPGLPRMVTGFLNLGGAAVPVIDLKALLSPDETDRTPATTYAHLMLLKPAADNSRIALLVEKVQDVTSCSEAPRPLSESETLNGCVTGIVEIKGRPVHVLAADRLLLEAERQQLASLTSVAQKRLGAWDLAL